MFLPIFASTAVLLLLFIDLASVTPFLNLTSVNGEVIYTCGFLIVFYIIWLEGFQATDSLSPVLTFSNLSFFWLQYKQIESILFALLMMKLNIAKTIVNIFSLSVLTLKVLNNLKISNFVFKLSLITLTKIKAKFKALPSL